MRSQTGILCLALKGQLVMFMKIKRAFCNPGCSEFKPVSSGASFAKRFEDKAFFLAFGC